MASKLVPGDVVVFEGLDGERRRQSELLSQSYKDAKFPVIGVVQGYRPNNSEAGYLNISWRTAKASWLREQTYIDSRLSFYKLTGSMKGVVKRSNLEFVQKNLGQELTKPGLLVGSDPELFAVDGKGELLPAFLFLEGKEGKTYGAPYWDGVQLEFRISPGHCLDGMVSNIRQGLWNALQAVRKVDPKGSLKLASVMDVPREKMASWEQKHVEFGCAPSLNAYDDHSQFVPGDARDILWRPAGGHMHFGMPELTNIKTATEVVKVLDKVIGVGCVSMFGKFDDPRRRMMYGRAGEFRLPKHGLEYRVLSPMWLAHPGVSQLVYDVARMAISMGMRGLGSIWDTTEDETRHCINTTDVNLAREILKRNEGILKQLLMACYHPRNGFESANNCKAGLHGFMRGVETLCDPENLEENWSLSNYPTPMVTARWTSLAEQVWPKIGQ